MGTATAIGTGAPARSSSPCRSCAAGSALPDWLLQPRRRAEQAFVLLIAGAYLAGVSTGRVEKRVRQLGVRSCTTC
jgi:hypothetical protein